MARQQASKTPAKTPVAKVKQPHGGAILQGGNPGNSGGGRPPDEFKAMCRQLASSTEVYARVKDILQQPLLYPSLYIGALKWASEHGYGKPKEHIEHTGEIKHGVVILPAVTTVVRQNDR